MRDKKIINLAIIAHVDAGKSTLVDALLDQSGAFAAGENAVECVMDSDDLERERGITIYSKNCAIEYKDYKINIVDTPGHADFSSEVERVIRSVDSAILLVDATEGPMPQTRFVLKKALELDLKPIVLINKIDKNYARPEEVKDEVLDLFIELQAGNEQLEFPTVYGIATEGIARYSLAGDSDDLRPLFDTIIERVNSYPDKNDKPLQMQVYDLAYDDYLGRLGIGRIYEGCIQKGQNVVVHKRDGSQARGQIKELFVYRGLNRAEVEKAESGDIAVIAGLPNISIGETVGEDENVTGLPTIEIEEPTLSMNFQVNDSPFAGEEGEYLTSRHLRERLEKELEVNVGLRVEEKEERGVFKVSGRGELHISVLLENMRREGYEVAVSRPEVLYRREEGCLQEPMEKVYIEVPEEYSGTVIEKLNRRRGMMEYMMNEKGYVRMDFLVPTRGLIGYESEFINDTRGEGTIIRSLSGYEPYQGEVPERNHGVLISGNTGVARAYALSNLSDRGRLFIEPGIRVYESMVIGINNKENDLTVNPCKNKELTNIRSSSSDEGIQLPPAVEMDLEDSLEFIADDELVEVTPSAVRIRKKIVDEKMRRKSKK